jgi:hypothetical protein
MPQFPNIFWYLDLAAGPLFRLAVSAAGADRKRAQRRIFLLPERPPGYI